jgi:hypothetical protein
MCMFFIFLFCCLTAMCSTHPGNPSTVLIQFELPSFQAFQSCCYGQTFYTVPALPIMCAYNVINSTTECSAMLQLKKQQLAIKDNQNQEKIERTCPMLKVKGKTIQDLFSNATYNPAENHVFLHHPSNQSSAFFLNVILNNKNSFTIRNDEKVNLVTFSSTDLDYMKTIKSPSSTDMSNTHNFPAPLPQPSFLELCKKWFATKVCTTIVNFLAKRCNLRVISPPIAVPIPTSQYTYYSFEPITAEPRRSLFQKLCPKTKAQFWLPIRDDNVPKSGVPGPLIKITPVHNATEVTLRWNTIHPILNKHGTGTIILSDFSYPGYYVALSCTQQDKKPLQIDQTRYSFYQNKKRIFSFGKSVELPPAHAHANT